MGRKHHQWGFPILTQHTALAEPLSRHQAVRETCHCIKNFATATLAMQRRVTQWVALFNIDAEELLEAGVDYESIRAVERRLLF